ncbi:MAG: hypothetical protein AAFW83_06955 [Pseudomonadota bacterium]
MEIVAKNLIDERKNVVSRLRDHEKICRELKTTLTHTDATLRHLRYYPDGAIDPKKQMSAGLFYKSEMPRLVMSILREKPDGIGLRYIVEAICHRKGWDIDDERFNAELRVKVSRTLDQQKMKKIVERVGDEAVGVWRASATRFQPV